MRRYWKSSAPAWRILIRVGSAANGIEELLRKIVENKLPTDNMFFCTDDKHLENIRSEGHINCIAALAVRAAFPRWRRCAWPATMPPGPTA